MKFYIPPEGLYCEPCSYRSWYLIFRFAIFVSASTVIFLLYCFATPYRIDRTPRTDADASREKSGSAVPGGILLAKCFSASTPYHLNYMFTDCWPADGLSNLYRVRAAPDFNFNNNLYRGEARSVRIRLLSPHPFRGCARAFIVTTVLFYSWALIKGDVCVPKSIPET